MRKLRDLDCLAWRKQRDLIDTYKYLQGRCQADEVRLLSLVPSNRTRDKGHKLEHKVFYFVIRKNFCEGGCPERLRSLLLLIYSKPAWTLSSTLL